MGPKSVRRRKWLSGMSPFYRFVYRSSVETRPEAPVETRPGSSQAFRAIPAAC